MIEHREVTKARSSRAIPDDMFHCPDCVGSVLEKIDPGRAGTGRYVCARCEGCFQHSHELASLFDQIRMQRRRKGKVLVRLVRAMAHPEFNDGIFCNHEDELPHSERAQGAHLSWRMVNGEQRGECYYCGQRCHKNQQ
ncbi:MAG: hypothetical protein WD850_01305 [Candidatus Spechtbacterales bacterium]